ncbi:SURF1 family protein [Paludibacterium purpuratum]|uniref:SURF1 family protein n=1 Tax=Paludibacterium purpuratum TaxID=1144873 RepID=UPI001FB7D36C|nr:SURF1 family protein [Paludibacterium purpuratum]
MAWYFYSSTLWALLLAAGLTFGLALWQWQRGADKARLIARFAAHADRVQRLPAVLGADPDMRRVRLSGQPLGAALLLENSLLDDGRPGVRVLQPYRLADGRAVLADRGWLADGGATPGAPVLSGADGRWMPAPRRFTLPGALVAAVGRVDAIDWPGLRSRLGLPLYAGVVVLGQAPAPLVPWPARPDVDPARHDAYALQWLLLSLGLLAAAVRHVRRRRPA